MQIDVAVSEITALGTQRHSEGWTEIVGKIVNVHRFRKFDHDCLLDI